MSNIILASQSSVRRTILDNAGIPHQAIAAHIDEDAIKKSMINDDQSVEDCAQQLAALKALKISYNHENAFVIGADQIALCGTTWLNKAKNPDDLHEKLLLLRNNTHYLVNAITIAHHGVIIWHYTDKVTLIMRDFSDKFLDDYVTNHYEQARHSVGGYLFEGYGVQLFSHIKGDYYSLLGLPLLPLLQQLRQLELCDY